MGGGAPTSGGRQGSRPEGVQSGQHGSAANGAGRPDGDLGKARRGRHKLAPEVYARSAITQLTAAQRAGRLPPCRVAKRGSRCGGYRGVAGCPRSKG